jgi:hypothetical protein
MHVVFGRFKKQDKTTYCCRRQRKQGYKLIRQRAQLENMRHYVCISYGSCGERNLEFSDVHRNAPSRETRFDPEIPGMRSAVTIERRPVQGSAKGRNFQFISAA